MATSMRIGRILGILLITFLTTGYTPEPDPEPVNKSFVSVFDSRRTRADRYFNNFEYKSAIKLYNKVIKKGKHDDDVILRLAQSYLKINDPVNAEKWFEKVINSDRITPQQQIEYAHTLMSNGKYQKAREVIDSYEFAQSDYRSKAIINTLEKLEVFYADSVYYQLETVQDNKPHYSDFSPTVYKDGIVFVSSRHDKGPKFKWDDSPFLDLYYTESDVASAKPFSENLNSKYHEGPIAFYDDFSKVVLTRSNYLDKELGMTDEGINNLQLYTATWNESQKDWDNISPVAFSINNYSYGHPTISTDDSKMYFISDMPGGVGGTDIYVSERNELGWGEPVNMGEVINTAGNEMYPFIDDQENLYFASNGHGGLGGLDVFQVKLTESFDIRNMGYPLNTTADDFGFTLTSNGEIAYISSNREGADNIFQIDIKAPNLDMVLADNSVNSEVPVLDESLELLATNELSTSAEDDFAGSELSTINAAIIDENNEVLDNANLKLLINGEESQTLSSNQDGLISIQVPADQEYTLIATKEGFEDRKITIPSKTLGLEEDLLIVMNSVFMDSELPNDMPATELDPLAVNDDPWNESAPDGDNRPAINGVALSEIPSEDTGTTNVDKTTELDPLAVNDDPWNESALDGDNRPAINGVALSEIPSEDTGAPNVDKTTELDPLAVNDDPWNESALDGNNRPAINGVALSEMPSDDAGAANVDKTTELDPLAVNDDPWNESALDGNNRPAINGVALSEMPSDDAGAANVDKTTELDPLAVNDDPWNESALDGDNRPAINGVALSEVPTEDTGATNVDKTTELDPLAVNDDPWNESALDGDNRPAINGVAFSEIPSEDTGAPNVDKTTELDPLAVNDDPWNESALDGNNRPAINGVALSKMPSDDAGAANVDKTTDLDPLAVNDDPWNESALDGNNRPAINGVALSEMPTEDTEATNVDETTDLDPLAVNDDSWNESALDGNNRPAINGVALSEMPSEDIGATNVDKTTELDPLAVNDDPWNESALDGNNRPAINGVALSETPTEDTEATNVDETTDLDPLAVNDDPWNESVLDGNNQPAINGVALSEMPTEETEATNVDNTTELDALAVNDDPLAINSESWDNSGQKEENYPSKDSEPLTNPSTTGNIVESNDASNSELNPLAVNENQWDNGGLEDGSNLSVDEVAMVDSEPTLTDAEQTRDVNEALASQNTDQLSYSNLNDDNESNLLNQELLAKNDESLNSQNPALEDSFENEATYISNNADINQERQQEFASNNVETKKNDFSNTEESALDNSTVRGRLVDAVALDTKSGLPLEDADIKLFIDSPNEPLDYEIRDGVLTFDARPEEDYIIVASHDDYQDQFINISGDDLLADETSELNLSLTKTQEVPMVDRSKKGSSTKFKALVRDQSSNEVLNDAEVKFFVDGKAIESEFSKDDGKTVFKSPMGNDYMMLVSREGYQDLIYHMPGIPQDNKDIDLSMLKADQYLAPEHKLLTIKDRVFDEDSGNDLGDITFKVFENGDLIETTDDLLALEVNPNKDYQILASKKGYKESIINLGPDMLNDEGLVDMEFALEEKEISESSGSAIYEVIDQETLPIAAMIFDVTDEQPLSEAVIIVLADNAIQEELTSWNSGSVTINAIPGKDYQLVVQREGYSDKVIALGVIDEAPSDDLSIALVPSEIKKVRQADIDLTNANMLVMSGPTGEEQLYLSTENELYQYSIENDNHYLIKDGEKFMLKERSRSLNGKVTDKQDTDQFSLRSEDQFLYDQLTGDEKAMVDKVVEGKLAEGELTNNPELAIYYNNLPPEYRSLIDKLVEDSNQVALENVEGSNTNSSERLKVALAENSISVSSVLNINNIYYDFDKSAIREDAAIELDKLLAIMQNNKNIRVAMFSHTDSRGSNNYNDILSKKRGSSAVNYLVERGISIDRFTTQAKGETQLVNSCGDQIKCNEDAHQLNRRTEFMLTA